MVKSTFIKTDICQDEYCKGCGACINICPKHCLTILQNEYGEDIPYIDSNNCIHCGLCNKVCQVNNVIVKNNPISCFAGWRFDQQSRKNSSSGGIASVLAEYYFSQGWHVFGTVFSKETGAIVIECKNWDDIYSLRGSKYVQSRMGTIFKSIESAICKNENSIFIGTPCQVSAVRSYLDLRNIDYANKILLVDFLCHGCVPGTYLSSEIENLETKTKSKCTNISFRSNAAEKNYYLCLYNNNVEFYCKKAEIQKYFYSFLHSITIRDSCFNCPYKTVSRIGDLSLGDFIGLGKDTPFEPEVENIGNPSLVLVNTSYGQRILDLIGDEIKLYIRDINEAVKGGPSLRGNIIVSKRRTKFRKFFLQYGYLKSIKRVTWFPILLEHVNLLFFSIKIRLKKIIKKL